MTLLLDININQHINIINSHYLIYFAQALYAQNFIKKHISKNKNKNLSFSRDTICALECFLPNIFKKEY